MKGFTITKKNAVTIHFNYYNENAPITIAAFDLQLPFTKMFFQAKVSGQEFWIDNAPVLDEVVIEPLHPSRAKTSGLHGHLLQSRQGTILL